MKLKIRISYEWEENLDEAWEDWKAEGYTIEEFKNNEISFNHAIERLDSAADNHILGNYIRDIETEWIE